MAGSGEINVQDACRMYASVLCTAEMNRTCNSTMGAMCTDSVQKHNSYATCLLGRIVDD